MKRLILHSDLNNFYASVECLYNPALRKRPVAVGGDIEKRHGIILSKNEEAKKYGVQTGEAIWQAERKCPGLITVPPHFERYAQFSRLARKIYMEFTDQVEPFGLDECWLDVSGSVRMFGGGREIADHIRSRVFSELGVTCSVGVSFNKIFAKLGSDMKKPNATTVISKHNFQEVVWPLPVEALLFVGPATKKKLYSVGIRTIGGLALADEKLLKRLLGKNGLMLKGFAIGLDGTPVAKSDAVSDIKSVSNSITTPRDLVRLEDVKITLYLLSESVAQRLRTQRAKASTIQLSIRSNTLAWYERQKSLAFPVCDSDSIFRCAYELFLQNHKGNTPIRSLGVRACGLSFCDHIQLSFLPDMKRMLRQNDLESSIDNIRRRFGPSSVQRGIMLTDNALSSLRLTGISPFAQPQNSHPY